MAPSNRHAIPKWGANRSLSLLLLLPRARAKHRINYKRETWPSLGEERPYERRKRQLPERRCVSLEAAVGYLLLEGSFLSFHKSLLGRQLITNLFLVAPKMMKGKIGPPSPRSELTSRNN